MNRSSKVILVAAFIFAVSGLALILSVRMLWTRIEDQRVSVLFLATGALGLVTGAGVFQLQAWARQFVLACVGLLVFVTAILTPVILFFNFPIDSGIPDLPQRDRTMLVVMCFFAVVIGLWCARILYEQAESFDTPRSPQPFSLAVIGAFLMLAGITGAVGLFNLQQPPTMTFGLVLTGWRAFAVLLFYSAISLSLGIGLLNQNEESRKLAIYYALFQVLNNGAFLLRPGRQRAVETFYEERLNYNPAWAVHLPVEGLSAFLRFWAYRVVHYVVTGHLVSRRSELFRHGAQSKPQHRVVSAIQVLVLGMDENRTD